jgi:transposase InsO family protein
VWERSGQVRRWCYIIAWKLCTTMKAQDVTDTLDLALTASGCDQARIVHKPRLLSDNGSSHVSAELAHWLDGQNMGHVRGAPYHPQTHERVAPVGASLQSFSRQRRQSLLHSSHSSPG